MKSISDAPVPLEFRNIFLNGLEGELHVKTLRNSKRMFFKDGNLIHSESDFFDERLGVILNLTGRVSDSQYDNISGLIHSVDDQVGTVLVQNGIISKDDLKEAVQYRIKRIAVSAFSIISGELYFLEGASPESAISGTRIPLSEIIYSGGKRIESVNCIRRQFYFNSPEPVRGNEKLYKLLNDEERELIETVRNSGDLSNARLITRSGLSSDRYWQGISMLYLLGIIDFSPDKKDKPTGDEIIGLVRLKNTIETGNADLYSILGVEEGDSVSSIQSAYYALTQKYDPDRFGSAISPEIKKSAQFVLRQLGKAFREINELRSGTEQPDIIPDDQLSPVPEEPEAGIGIPESLPEVMPREDQFDSDEFFHKFERGKDLYQSNKFDEALIPLKEALKLGKPSYENYLYLGLCQTHLPFFSDEAERNLKKAIELVPSKSEPVHALGKLYLQLKRKKNARKCFERAVELEPGNIEAAQDLFRLKYPPKTKKKLFSREK